MQGLNLIERLKNGRATRSEFFYEHTFFGSPRLPEVEAIINPEMKYILYTEHGYEELFDLTKDPYEESNLAADPAYKDILVKQRQVYQSLKKAAN